MFPAVGSISSATPGGRFGLVLRAQRVGAPSEGQQLVALRLKAVDGRDSNGFKIDDAAATQNGAAVRAGSPVQAATPTANGPPATARLHGDLNPAEKQAVARLQQRDAQVRQEENAHAGTAGDLAGPINYIYAIGPDGRQYAIGGSVSIKAAAVTGDPEELKRIGARLHVAAQAAVNPSAQDLAAARTGIRLYSEATKIGRETPEFDISA